MDEHISFDLTPIDMALLDEFNAELEAEQRFIQDRKERAARMAELDRRACEVRKGLMDGYRACTPPDEPIRRINPLAFAFWWCVLIITVLVSVYHTQIAAFLAGWD